MRVGTGVSGSSLFPTDAASMIPAQPIPGAQSIDTPWSQGYVSNAQGIGGTGSVLAATAFDAWYNQGAPVPEGTVPNQPTIPALGLMYAIPYRGDAAVAPFGFTPLKVNMAKVKLNRATAIEYNAAVANGSAFTTPPPGNTKPVMPVTVSVAGFRSYHPELILIAMGDASVQKVGEQVDPRIWVSMSTFAGGETFNTSSSR